jgi:heparin/heparan-sulfate lyase
MKKALILCLSILTAIVIPAADRPAAETTVESEIRAAAAAFTSGDAANRARAGFRIAALRLQLRQDADALAVNQEIAGLPGIAAADRNRALGNIAEIALFKLNNVAAARNAAGQLANNPNATPEQRKRAEALLAMCKIKKESAELLPEELPQARKIAARIRRDHPRMFFNAETWPRIEEHLKRPEIRRYYEKNVKEPAAALPDEPKLWNGERGQTRTPQNTYVNVDRPTLWGLAAARCALVHRLEKDPGYLEKAKKLLNVTAEALGESYRVGVAAGDYYGMEVVYALAAYDWIFNELSPDERQRIGKALLTYSFRTENEGNRFADGNGQPENSGFYGSRMLKWYAALATIHDGIDEKIALKLLYEGYADHEVMLNARDQTTGDDGGFVSCANNYTMGTYLWSTFNYLHTFRSAIGEDRAEKLAHLRYFPQWCAWNLIKGTPREIGEGKERRTVEFFDFGVGDTENTDKAAVNADMHMYEICHFIPNDPALRTMAMGSVSGNPLDEALMKKFRILTPLFLYDMPEIPETFLRVDPGLRENARFFENLGIAFMRSGSGPADTYACFVTNKKIWQHRHYDANSFMIYKHDFLALDTGTRIGFRRNDYEHLNAYYAQTVAHNAMLIHLPEEELPGHWLTPREKGKFFHHGGQRRTSGDRCAAYETNDLFTYIAGDATAVYTPEKCRLALRQFVFLYPDTFVIADRVISTNPEYRKEWLLHTQNEPVFLDRLTFRADDGGGRLFCRTIFPADAVPNVVGGPGREFFASGVNWELPEAAQKYAAVKNHFGRYRVEVAPGQPNRADCFLHVIQVGSDKLEAMAATKTLEDAASFGVELADEKGVWQVRFAKEGPAAGAIRLTGPDGKVVFDRPLRRDVQPQSGLGEPFSTQPQEKK